MKSIDLIDKLNESVSEMSDLEYSIYNEVKVYLSNHGVDIELVLSQRLSDEVLNAFVKEMLSYFTSDALSDYEDETGTFHTLNIEVRNNQLNIEIE